MGIIFKDATEDEIEKDYVLIGITGVEDTLQDNVIECIRDFRDAGINVWMLTGDKLETAQCIASTCGLTDSSMKLCFINDHEVKDNLAEAKRLVKKSKEIKKLP